MNHVDMSRYFCINPIIAKTGFLVPCFQISILKFKKSIVDDFDEGLQGVTQSGYGYTLGTLFCYIFISYSRE